MAQGQKNEVPRWPVEFDCAPQRCANTATHGPGQAHNHAVLLWRRIAWLTSANGSAGYRRILAKAEHLERTGELPTGTVPWRQVKAELGLEE